jgi:hypothetical protein
MRRAKVALGISIWVAASLAFAQEPAKPAGQASPKTEQPATAAGGQSAGASPGTAAAGASLHVETIAMVLGAIGAAVVVGAVANDSTTQH